MVDDTYLDKSMSKACETCGQMFYRDKRCTWAHWERVKDCSRVCVGRRNTVRSDAKRLSREAAFNRNVDKSGECWIWTAAKDKDGYGIFSYKRKNARANRVALELDGRAPGVGQYACHTCDNPACVNPSHLYPGTPRDNVQDMLVRGRAKVGSLHHCARLDEDAVRYIRASNENTRHLAARFNVTLGAVQQCRAGKTWKHVA